MKADHSTRDELKSKLINICAFLASDDCEEWQRGYLLDEVTAISRVLESDTQSVAFTREAARILGCKLPGPVTLAVA